MFFKKVISNELGCVSYVHHYRYYKISALSDFRIYTQREVSNNIVLELRTLVLKNRVSSLWYQYKNEMMRREKLN